MRIETTGCGHASATSGSGVIMEPGLVLTAAHVVAGAAGVQVVASAGTWSGEIVVLDRTRDLALLRVSELTASPVELTQLAGGDRGQVVVNSSPGVTPVTVTRRVQMTVDEVRGADRHRRGGYELDARIDRGHSGSGLFSDDRLAGIVFAVPSERDATFAVRAEEIEAVLDRAERSHACDPEESLVVPATSP